MPFRLLADRPNRKDALPRNLHLINHAPGILGVFAVLMNAQNGLLPARRDGEGKRLLGRMGRDEHDPFARPAFIRPDGSTSDDEPAFVVLSGDLVRIVRGNETVPLPESAHVLKGDDVSLTDRAEAVSAGAVGRNGDTGIEHHGPV